MCNVRKWNVNEMKSATTTKTPDPGAGDHKLAFFDKDKKLVGPVCFDTC